MHSFEELSTLFKEKFNQKHFPDNPSTLYEPGDYFLTLGGKRIRPVMCLMSNELFDEINPCRSVPASLTALAPSPMYWALHELSFDCAQACEIAAVRRLLRQGPPGQSNGVAF